MELPVADATAAAFTDVVMAAKVDLGGSARSAEGIVSVDAVLLSSLAAFDLSVSLCSDKAAGISTDASVLDCNDAAYNNLMVVILK